MFLKSTIKLFFYLCLIILNSIVVNAETDCDTLSILFNHFGIADKITWPANSNKCCTVDVVTCINDRITELDFMFSNLNGTIANEIGSLTELTRLDIRYNLISGTIPESIASNKKLRFFNVGANKDISGNIPKAICSLTNLEALYLYGNRLSGTIPNCIGELIKLRSLCVDDNQLTGVIPSSIGNLENLVQLDMEKNNLSGTIPESFANLKKLEMFIVQGNKDLIGPIPEITDITKWDFTNTDLCVKDSSKVYSEDLRQCTDEDFKKVKEFNDSLANQENDKSKTDNHDNSNQKSGMIIPIIITVVILISAIFVAFMFVKRNKSKEPNRSEFSSSDEFRSGSIQIIYSKMHNNNNNNNSNSNNSNNEDSHNKLKPSNSNDFNSKTLPIDVDLTNKSKNPDHSKSIDKKIMILNNNNNNNSNNSNSNYSNSILYSLPIEERDEPPPEYTE